MKWSAALVFLALFLLVAVFYVGVEFPAPKAPAVPQPQEAAAQKPLPAAPAAALREEAEDAFSPALLELLPEDRLTLIQVQNLENRKTVKLAFEEGLWRIQFPVQAEADPAKAEDLLAGLFSVQKLRQLRPEKSWEEYGLSRPRLKIGLETAKKTQRRYLYLGNPSPVGGVVFARWEDEKTYFLLPEAFEGLFDQSVYDLREKRLFRKNAGLPQRLRLESPTGTYEIENQGAQWVWKEPEALRWSPCPAGDAEALLERLRGLFVKDFLENTAPEESGLDSSAVRIRIGFDGGRAEVLEVGKEAGVRDAFYARQTEGAQAPKPGAGRPDGILLVARDKLNAFFDLFRSLAAQRLTQA